MMHPLVKNLLEWYRAHERELPWRSSRNPYYIWLSEVILQQTRVDQGTAYYLRFVEQFPTVEKLAEASEEEVLKLWQGLGYYSRARNLLSAAKQVVQEFNGTFPSSANELQKLKGIGPYTAAAIASIAFDKDVAVVDGNVHRVISRLFDIDEPVNKPSGHQRVEQAMTQLLPSGQAGTFNQAVMEFGALHCTPKNPSCESCQLNEYCLAYQRNTATIRPVKAAKTKVKKIWIDYYLIVHNDHLLMRKRENSGIWQNLYDFPNLESDHANSIDDLHADLTSRGAMVHQISLFAGPMTHILSHRHITARFFKISCDRLTAGWCDTRPIPLPEIMQLPVPRLIEKALEQLV